ncbi:hypothetical protein HCK00_14625 [Streptomyces sp. PLAI1-29]|uniref:TIGR02234 family membrane protein n=1 Tax=Streptomyces zingiberis TaxID=2053010 RepID=A0ABX1BVN1_9ACTN|nr:hypothetical protein [Streptomyces zingiberis]
MGVVNGVPGHVLLVHGAVVLVPLTALFLVVCALWASVARRLSWLVPLLGLITLVLVVLSTESGEWLEERVEESALMERHTELGGGLTPWAAALFVLTLVVWWVGRAVARRPPGAGGRQDVPEDDRPRGGGSGAARTVSSLPVRIVVLLGALAVAVGATVQVYRIGDSGAKAVWEGNFSQSQGDDKR